MKVPQYTNSIPLKKIKLFITKIGVAITLTACTYSSCRKSFLPRPYYYPYRWNRWFLPVELPTNATAGELHRCISCNRVYCSRLTT